MQKYLWKIMKIIIPLLGILGFKYMLNIVNNNNLIINNAFINFTLFIGLFYIYEKEIFNNKLKKSYVIFSVLFSIFLSTVTIIGSELELTSNIVWTIENFVNCILLSIVVFPIVFIIVKYIQEHQFMEKQIKIKHLGIVTFCIILFFTFLVYLALYPGVYAYDSIFQVDRIFNKCMDTHYSVLFCYILGRIRQVR